MRSHYCENDFFYSHANKAHFRNKVKVFGTREWLVEKDVFSVPDTGGLEEKNLSTPLNSGTYDLLAPVAQKLDSAIRLINHYPADKC